MRAALPAAANASIASSSVRGLKYRISVMSFPPSPLSVISLPSDYRLTLLGPARVESTRAQTVGTASGGGPSGRLLCAERACVGIVAPPNARIHGHRRSLLRKATGQVPDRDSTACGSPALPSFVCCAAMLFSLQGASSLPRAYVSETNSQIVDCRSAMILKGGHHD